MHVRQASIPLVILQLNFLPFFPGVSMVATAVGLYLIPFCKTAVLLMVTMSVFGASVGVVDTGA